MTEKENLLGNLFREALYSGNSVPEIMELFSDNISRNFTATDFLLLQMASQLKESAQIRKVAHEYMKMMSTMSSQCFSLINTKHPSLHFCTSQRFKSFIRELYKRYERVQDGLSPEIKDLPAVRIILLEAETQETIKMEYIIAREILENFSSLNSNSNFPLYVNLSVPDKSVTESSFNPDEHKDVLIPEETILIPELGKLGKDYLHYPKEKGYQSFHISFELVKKSDPTFRIFAEVQIRTISQHMYAEFGPASHNDYENLRTERLLEIFDFEKENVHICGYFPNKDPNLEMDFSGFSKPTFVTERSKTF